MTSRFFCFALVVVLLFTVERQTYAVITVFSEFPVEIYVNGAKHDVVIPAYVASYENGDNCGNSNHKTSKGQRCFAHLHVTAPFPTMGKDAKGVQWVVNENTVNAYWDREYGSDYVSTGGADPTFNCWAHAFGYFDIWIQDPTYIYEDDYEPVTTLTAGFPVSLRTVIKKPGHVIPVYGVTLGRPGFPNGFVEMTWEKNRSSGGYQRYYSVIGSENPIINEKFYQKKW